MYSRKQRDRVEDLLPFIFYLKSKRLFLDNFKVPFVSFLNLYKLSICLSFYLLKQNIGECSFSVKMVKKVIKTYCFLAKIKGYSRSGIGKLRSVGQSCPRADFAVSSDHSHTCLFSYCLQLLLHISRAECLQRDFMAYKA